MYRQEASLAAEEGDLREFAEVRLREVAHVSVLRDDATALDKVHLLEVRAGTDAVADGVQFLLLSSQSFGLLCRSDIQTIYIPITLGKHRVQYTDSEVLTLKLFGESEDTLLLVFKFLTQSSDRAVQALVFLTTRLQLLGQLIKSFTAGTELIVDQEHVVLDTITLRALEVATTRIDIDHPFDGGDLLEVRQDTGHEGVCFMELSLIVLIDQGE